jgi:hypothetical protein
MTYLCMTPDELAGWLEAAERVRNGGRTPCTDCPMAYHLAMKAVGRCNRVPVATGRPMEVSPDPAVNERRARWRASSRRQRERVAA